MNSMLSQFKITRALVLSLLLCSFHSPAATVPEELLSPVTTEAAPVFLASSLMSVFMLYKQKEISEPATYQASKDRPLKNYSILGDLFGQVYPNIAYVAVMAGHGYFSNSNKSWYRAGHMTKATLYAGLVVTVLKYTVREPRPDNPNERNSFPSGHTATAFAFGATVAMQHSPVVGSVALVMASFTAYSRMNDGRHYLHDVVAGMTLGIGYGMGIYYSQRGRANLLWFL